MPAPRIRAVATALLLLVATAQSSDGSAASRAAAPGIPVVAGATTSSRARRSTVASAARSGPTIAATTSLGRMPCGASRRKSNPGAYRRAQASHAIAAEGTESTSTPSQSNRTPAACTVTSEP